jgi:23S rRNA (adenine2503-C2)-methyltransferase
MDRDRIQKILDERKEPAFRGKQIMAAVYGQRISAWEEATALSKDLRDALVDVPVSTLTLSHRAQSKKDGTVKALFKLADNKEIEAVMIPNGDFRTVCVSSQVGCAMKCSFCATGTMGLKRNLRADEIVDQVLYFEKELAPKNERVTNVVFMGMGEPCANLDNVFEAIRIMNAKDGLGIGARKISISTCGIVPGIRRITDFDLQINLAVSLHAPTDDVRSEIMPVNKAYSIGQVLEACRDYVRKTNRKIFFEYVMLSGINDSIEQADELAAVLKDFRPLVQVNLIPFHQSFFEFRPTARAAIERFQSIVLAAGIPCTIRHSAGVDIAAACGQLALERKEK